MAVRIEAAGRVLLGMCRARARRRRSVWVVALEGFGLVVGLGWMDGGGCLMVNDYLNGSPTTRKATSSTSARCRIASLLDSTISRSARMTGRP